MTNFRLDICRETGEATLWMETEETACGYKPVLAWPGMDGVREFALMLLEIDHQRRDEKSTQYGRFTGSTNSKYSDNMKG